MSKQKKKKFTPQAPSLSQFPDAEILVEAAMRRGQSLNELIKPSSQSASRVSLDEWKRADQAAKNVDYPDRNPMYRVYDNIDIDLDLTSVIETRTLKVKQAKFNIVGKDKKPNEDAKLLLDKSWFRDFLANGMRRVTRGYQVIETFKFNDAGELTECVTLNEYHVKPNKGIVTKEESDDFGISYLDKNYQLYYIPVGKPSDMGLMRKLAPIILAKKYAIGHWSNFNEKMGIPFRTVHTKSADKTRQQQLAIIMDQMGAAGWAVLTEDERVELMDIAATNPTQCFETFINMLNAQIAMALNGQSSTADSSKQKGTYGSLKILNEISEDRHQSDLTDIKDLVNDELFPRLVQISPFYSILKDCKLEWDDSEKLSVKEVVDVIVNLTSAGYKISAQTVTQKTGIEVEEGPAPTKPVPPAAAKKKSLTDRVSNLYESCCNLQGIDARAVSIPSFEQETLRIARQLFDNKHNGVVDIPLMKRTAAYLREGIISGFGTSTDDKDRVMLSTLEHNVFVFSGFKTYQTLKEISSKLVDDNGNVRSWESFRKEVLKVDKTYNVNYLKAEYDHALICGQATSQWQDIQRNKHILRYLEFDATNDNRTTQICLSLDGVRLPVDHPFWDTYFLPLHFGERSVIRQVAGGVITDITKITPPELNPMFEGNVGKTGISFPSSHPYYEASMADKKAIQQAIDKVHADPENTKVVYTKNDRQLTVHNLHNKKEVKANTRVGKVLVDNGHDVLLPPNSYEPGIKNPDAIIDGNQVADFKGMNEPTMNAAYGAIKRAGKQGAEICVLEPVKSLSTNELKRSIFAALGNPKRSKSVKELWLIYKKTLVVITRAEVAAGTFVEKLE